MAITNSYYDPDTSMVWMYKSEASAVSVGSSQVMTLGLEDTSFDDVKIKILSIEYRAFILTNYNNSSRDNNIEAFNSKYRSSGQVLFGVQNESITSTTNSLDDFTGSSGWPVRTTAYNSAVGNPYSLSYTWKPNKLAFSNEQVALASVKADSSFADAQPAGIYLSLVIRGIRL